jgi:cytochrome d ubiquinol oxidase subunit I
MFLSGDWAASVVGHHQKPKLAAMEAHFKTTKGAPLIIGGWPDIEKQEVRYGIEIPKLLSLLVHRDPNAEVVGLADFPPGTTPDPRMVHTFFDLMVGSFFVMLTAAICYWWANWRQKKIGRRLLILILIASPCGIIALESGWMVTEFGRQPWAVQGLMRVADGVTPNSGIAVMLALFVALYLALTAGMLKLLFRKRPDGKGLEVTQEGGNVNT